MKAYFEPAQSVKRYEARGGRGGGGNRGGGNIFQRAGRAIRRGVQRVAGVFRRR